MQQESAELLETLLAPLRRLAEGYRAAARLADDVARGLDALAPSPAGDARPAEAPAAGRLRPQHRQEPPSPTPRGKAADPPPPPSADHLEDLRTRITALPYVGHVSVLGDSEGRVTLRVELAEEQRPTVRCAVCGRLLEAGGTAVSHGLCLECAERMTGGLGGR
ncbi:MAG: hypothetical protein IT304_03450 [Dehalococcoidia bacterium]|nr:hypothetical protein [Dehalococcoidia bacterium]